MMRKKDARRDLQPLCEPTPGYVPAVRASTVWYAADAAQSGGFDDPGEAYEEAAWGQMTNRCPSARRFVVRHLAKAGYWKRVESRLAAFLRAQDRKHGGTR